MLNDNLNKFDNQFQLAIIHENKTDMTMLVIKNQEVTLAPLMTLSRYFCHINSSSFER